MVVERNKMIIPEHIQDPIGAHRAAGKLATSDSVRSKLQHDVFACPTSVKQVPWLVRIRRI